MSGQLKPERGNRIFQHFGRWALVPDAHLQKLRQSLGEVQKLVGPAVAVELLNLLGLVDQELHRRAHTA